MRKSFKKEVIDDTPEEISNVAPCGHDKTSRNDSCPTCELYKLDNKTVSVTGELSEEDTIQKNIRVTYISYKEKKKNDGKERHKSQRA